MYEYPDPISETPRKPTAPTAPPDCDWQTLLRYGGEMGHCLCVMDQHAALIRANTRAESLMDKHPSVFIANGHLRLTRSHKTRALLAQLRDVVKKDVTRFLRADDGCNDWPLALALRPIQIEFGSASSRRLALANLISPRQGVPQVAAFAEALDLTPRQIVLLQAFASGLPFQAIAKREGIKHQTVREVFSDIYRKVGVRDQTELARLLASLPCHL